MTGLITYRKFSLNDTPSLDGKVALVTGGQQGIGKDITAQLLLHGIKKVYVLARSKDKFDSAREEWSNTKGISLDKNPDRVEFVQCDLSDIKAVKDAAESVKQRTDVLHILICNAGLGISPQYKRSRQNIESVFATNCVGHQVLVTLLLPLLKETVRKSGSDVRVVVTSSSLHSMCKHLDVDLLTSPTPTKPAFYDGIWRYARSKLGGILFTTELTRRLQLQAQSGEDEASKQIYVNVFFPGNIVTEQWTAWDKFIGKFLASILRNLFAFFLGQSAKDGAATAIYLAASEDIPTRDIKGRYFIPIAKQAEPTSQAKDMKLAKQLWEWIEEKATETLGADWKGSVGGPTEPMHGIP